MPPLRNDPTLRSIPSYQLALQILGMPRSPAYWSDATQQYVFVRAIEIIRRPNPTASHTLVALEALSKLVSLERTWHGHPTPREVLNMIRSRNVSNENTSVNSNNSMNTSNVNSSPRATAQASSPPRAAAQASSPPRAAAQAPNYSKASAAVKKWLATRPHTVYMNVVKIKLPEVAKDPVALYNFKSGNEAVMVIKKRVIQGGQVRSKRNFYTKNTIESLARKKWRTILRMKGPEVVFKDPLNRRRVYRRDLMNVKFH